MILKEMFAKPETADHQVSQRQLLYSILDAESDQQLEVRFLAFSKAMIQLGIETRTTNDLSIKMQYQCVCCGVQFLTDYLEKRFRNERQAESP